MDLFGLWFNYKRHNIKKNNNQDGQFYIITGTHMEIRGSCGNVNAFIRKIIYAEMQGYISVIDCKYVKNCFIEEKDLGIINGWELFLSNQLVIV